MASAIRLDDHLVQAASTEAALNHRTTPKQIEMWAAIGRAVAQGVSMEDALAVSQGLARVHVERVVSHPVETSQVFERIQQARASKQLAQRLQANRVVYQASAAHPGYLEEIHPDGKRRIGIFENGVFVVRQVTE